MPELFLDRVCVHLSYEDVFALRCTCKTLKLFVDKKEFTRLNLFVRKFTIPYRLFYTGEFIGHENSLHSNDSAILHSTRFREQFANVQKMAIYMKTGWNDFKNSDATGLNLKFLNCFKALNHLEVVGFTSVNGKLNLQELRVASFQIGYDFRRTESSFELDCSRLRALRVHRCWPVLTDDTNQLEHLRYCPHGAPTDYLKSISPNLRKLSTIRIQSIEKTLQLFSDLKSDRLSLPSLDRVELEPWLELRAIDLLGELASGLEDLQGNPQTKHIQFILYGRPIRSPEELRQIVRLLEDFKPETEGPNRGRVLSNRYLGDHSLRFLNGNPELQFLLSEAESVTLSEDVEWSEEVIKKLEGIRRLQFQHQFQPCLSTFELFARISQWLCSLTLYHQTVTGRLLEMLSKYLVNLESINIYECRYETVKPLAKFRNLEDVSFDFEPHRDELTFLFENNRTIETICIYGKDMIRMIRTTTGPKVLEIRTEKVPITKFDTLHAMIDYFYRKRLFEVSEKRKGSTRLDQFVS